MTEPRTPKPGEIQLAVLMDGVKFIAWAPALTLDDLMDAFERRAKLTWDDRSNLERQMSIRLSIVERIRWPAAGAAFTDVLAAGFLWLSFRHYSSATKLRAGLDAQVAETGSAVLTISCDGNSGALHGTAWSFMIHDRIHDGREQLADMPPARVRIAEGTRAS